MKILYGLWLEVRDSVVDYVRNYPLIPGSGSTVPVAGPGNPNPSAMGTFLRPRRNDLICSTECRQSWVRHKHRRGHVITLQV